MVTPEEKPNSFYHLIYSSFATVRLSQRDLIDRVEKQLTAN